MIDTSVRAELIATLYRQSVPVLLANLLNALIVSITLWGSASRPILVVWTSAMAVMTVGRIELRRRYWRSRPGPEAAARWGHRFVAGSVVAGVLWGGAALLLFDPDHLLSQLLITFVIGGMGASAAGTISCHPPAFVAYLVPSVAPLALRMLSLGEPLYLGMGAMTVVYGFAISAVARTTHRALTMAFRLRFENESLVERLSTAQLSLEETNQTLERRVAERSLALERQGETLRNAQRMESVGRLAGGIAHDFNNLLTVVLANATKLLRDGVDAGTRTALEDVRGAASRGADLVRQLLTFSRRQRTTPRLLDLNRVVRDMQRLLSRLVEEPIELSLATTQEPLIVSADASQLEQVVVNLVTNARDAMPGGGRLAITTAGVTIEAGHPSLVPGPYARLSISDTGVGMDAETQRRAFDPFFTTKELGQGTGLGLATVYGIIQQSGGQVALQSQPNRGTRFDVLLPRITGDTLPDTTAPAVATLEAPPATILVVEDESIVRSVIVMLLESHGHRILAAKDGEQALALLAENPTPIELMITDVVMAGMGGPELARRVREQCPDTRLLFISGYSWETELPAGALGREIDFLEKPFTTEALLQKVATVLGRTTKS